MVAPRQPYEFSKLSAPETPSGEMTAPSGDYQFSKLSPDTQYGWRNKQWENDTRPEMFALGANKAITDLAGAPVDAATWLLNKIPGVDIQEPVLGSEWLRARGRDIGLHTTADMPPKNLGEEMLSGAGETTAMVPMVAMTAEGLLRQGVAKAPGIGRYILESLRGNPSIADQAMITGAAATAGATGKLFAHQVPPPYRGLAETTGQIIGGGLVPASEAALRATYRGIRGLVEPFTTAGQEQLAGKQILGAATKPEDLQYNLATKPEEIVPGSTPTTYQMTNDPGLGQLERAVATRNADLFSRRIEDQNAARVASLEGMKPPGAQPGAVGQFFKDQLRAIDDAGAAQVAAEAARLRTAMTGMGGNRFTAARDYGEAIRTEIQTAANEAKQRARLLWEALPSGTKVDASPLATAAKDIRASMNVADEPMSAVEKGIFDTAESLGANANFGNFKALRTRIGNYVRERARAMGSYEAPDIARLQRLKTALDGSLANNMDNIAAAQQKAIAAGEMRPEDSFAAWLEANKGQFYEQRGTGSGPSGGGTGASGYAANGPTAVPPGSGGESTPVGGPPRPASTAGVPEETPSSVFDRDQLAAYQAARQATQEYKSTFREGSVGQSLATTGSGYRIGNAAVADKFWNAGKATPENVQAFMKAVGSREDAVNLLQDYAAFDLLRDAGRNGAIDIGRYNAWMRKHAEALDQFPELRTMFENAGRAQEAVDAASAARIDAKHQFETGAARLFLGDVDPQVAVRRAFSTANPERTFTDLIGLTRSNPDAANGLKRAVAEYITGRFSRTALAGEESWIKNPDSFLTFMRQQEKPLRVLFGDDGYQVIKNIGMDIERSNRSLRTKLPGQSNTAQDLANQRRLAGTPTLLQEIAREAIEVIAAGLGAAAAGPLGAATGFLMARGANVFSRMKAARMNTVNDLITQAMLNPELARTLLARVPVRAPESLMQRLAQQLSRLATYGAIYSANREDRASVQ